MSDLPDDNSLQETLETTYKAIRMKDDIAECDQARNVVLSIYIRLFEEERTLKKAKQSAGSDLVAFQVAQSKLDLVNDLLSIDGLEELAQLLEETESEQSGLGKIIISMKEPRTRDDWFHVIRDAVITFQNKNGFTPSNPKLWSVLITNPPNDYNVEFNNNCLSLPDGNKMDRENFNKRYNRYFPANES